MSETRRNKFLQSMAARKAGLPVAAQKLATSLEEVDKVCPLPLPPSTAATIRTAAIAASPLAASLAATSIAATAIAATALTTPVTFFTTISPSPHRNRSLPE